PFPARLLIARSPGPTTTKGTMPGPHLPPRRLTRQLRVRDRSFRTTTAVLPHTHGASAHAMERMHTDGDTLMGIRLGDSQYGKAEVHLVHVNRDTNVHHLKDINVTSQLRGDLEELHTVGDNAKCLATEPQNNTLYAKAGEWGGVGAIEDFALGLVRHFVTSTSTSPVPAKRSRSTPGAASRPPTARTTTRSCRTAPRPAPPSSTRTATR